MYRVAVCDDISIEAETMIEVIKRKAEECGIMGICYYAYGSGEELINDIGKQFDVIFLDIQMRGMSGNETAELIRMKEPEVIIVFYSGTEVPTPSMFRVQPYRYIVKQFTKEKIRSEVGEVLEKMISRQRKDFCAVHGGIRYNVRYEDILYISRVKRGCEIWIVPEALERYKCSRIFSEKTIRQVYEILNDCRFAFVHNSYVINIQHIFRSSRTEVYMKDGTNLTIARSKSGESQKRILEYSSSKYERNNEL